MEKIKAAIAVVFHKFDLYKLFPSFNEGKRTGSHTYTSCLNALYLSTDAVCYFQEAPKPVTTPERYLMVFGVLQAFIVQQDALRFMHKLLVDPETPKKFKPKGTAWMQLRDLRDSVAGHPASL